MRWHVFRHAAQAENDEGQKEGADEESKYEQESEQEDSNVGSELSEQDRSAADSRSDDQSNAADDCTDTCSMLLENAGGGRSFEALSFLSAVDVDPNLVVDSTEAFLKSGDKDDDVFDDGEDVGSGESDNDDACQNEGVEGEVKRFAAVLQSCDAQIIGQMIQGEMSAMRS